MIRTVAAQFNIWCRMTRSDTAVRSRTEARGHSNSAPRCVAARLWRIRRPVIVLTASDAIVELRRSEPSRTVQPPPRAMLTQPIRTKARHPSAETALGSASPLREVRFRLAASARVAQDSHRGNLRAIRDTCCISSRRRDPLLDCLLRGLKCRCEIERLPFATEL